MSLADPRNRRPRRCQPIAEGLETRELMSAAPRLQTGTDLVNSAVIQKFANLLYGPGSPSPMEPTKTELKNQLFTATWEGQYTVGSPRFDDRASTIHAWAVSGGSNQFLKGKFNMMLFPPADPSATPTPGNPYANQVTGIAGLFAQNMLQSGSALVLDLNATPAPGSNPLTLPTDLSWTYDKNASAGGYAAPQQYTAGGRGAHDPMDSRCPPAAWHDGIGEDDRQVRGAHQPQPGR